MAGKRGFNVANKSNPTVIEHTLSLGRIGYFRRALFTFYPAMSNASPLIETVWLQRCLRLHALDRERLWMATNSPGEMCEG